MGKFRDLSGQRFGRLLAIDQAPNSGRRTMWNCLCDCGARKAIMSIHLASGSTRSCGCLNIELGKHGWSIEEIAFLEIKYSNTTTRDLANRMNRTEASINGMARQIGFKKSDALRAPLREMTGKSGVYVIVDPAGDMYVGSTVNMSHRWHIHRYQLRKGKHHSHTLQAVWSGCGDAGLSFKVLEYCEKDDLHAVEQRFFDGLSPKHNIYVTAGSPAGMRVSAETKQKLSEHFKGRVISEETRAKRPKALKGIVKSADHRAKLSAAYPHCKSVRCVETGQIFRSTVDATRWIQDGGRPTASNSMIIKVCKGAQKTAYGFTWQYVSDNEKREAA